MHNDKRTFNATTNGEETYRGDQRRASETVVVCVLYLLPHRPNSTDCTTLVLLLLLYYCMHILNKNCARRSLEKEG